MRKLIIHAAGVYEHGHVAWTIRVFGASGRELHTASGCAAVGAAYGSQIAQYAAVLQACKWAAKQSLGARIVIDTPLESLAAHVRGTGHTRIPRLIRMRDTIRALIASRSIRIEWMPVASNQAKPLADKKALQLAPGMQSGADVVKGNQSLPLSP